MMVRSTVTTIGSATNDIMFYTNDMMLLDNRKDLLRQRIIGFEYGAKIYSDKVYFTYGGGGANAAVALAKLGIKTQAILSIAKDDVGRGIFQKLKSERVGTKMIQRNDKQRTGTSFVANVSESNEHVIFVYRGANDAIRLDKKIIRKINTPWLYLASPSARIYSSFRDLFAHCRKKNIKIAWNPGSDQIKKGIDSLARFMKDTTVFDVNRDEALELLLMGSKGKSVPNNPRWLVKELHKYGQEFTILTDGPKGAYLYDGNKVIFHKALKKRCVNTTGAGDCFGSSFVAGLIKFEWDLERAMKLAILNSNSVVTKVGAQEGLLSRHDLKRFNL